MKSYRLIKQPLKVQQTGVRQAVNRQSVYFVGRPDVVAHHAAPLAAHREIHILEPADVVARAEPADLAIVTTEHFDQNRECIQLLRERRVATLYMIDGILEWRNAWENRPDEPACPFTMRPVLSDKVACIGPSQARVLIGWGNHGKTEIVGVPRFDSLLARPVRPVSHQGPFQLLVMTAKCPAFTTDQRDDVIRSLSDLQEWLEQNPRINGRPVQVHWRLTGGLDRAIGVANETTDLTGRELVDQIDACDAVISTPSTGVLEAMLLQRPTAILDYTNSPAYVSSAWSITSARHLDRVIPELLDPPPRKLLFQRQQLEDALLLGGQSTERMLSLVDAMLEHAARLAKDASEWRFPASMLEPPTQALETLVHPMIYPEYPEFAEEDVRVLQTEWAHARREIAHLQSRIEQLESELGQAHEIFDQIRRHPIAGPIVRARESIMSFLSRMRPLAERAEGFDGEAMAEPRPASTKPVSKPR